MVKVKFKNQHTKPVRRIVPRSTSLFAPINSKRPAARYYGDYDGDGVINGLDCEPRNKFKQGPQHRPRCDMCGSYNEELKPDRINPNLYKVCKHCIEADNMGEELHPMDWAK